MTNLYDELGVERDASEEEIKRAGRDAAKRNHPDKGGNPEAFHRAQTALAVLRDPARRAQYDRDGSIDDEPENNPVLSAVMAAFEKALERACEDPAFTDLAAIMRVDLLNNAANGEAANRGIREAIIKLEQVAKRARFKGEGQGPFSTLLAARISMNERNIVTNQAQVDAFRGAAKFVEEFLEYVRDEPPPFPKPPGETWTLEGLKVSWT